MKILLGLFVTAALMVPLLTPSPADAAVERNWRTIERHRPVRIKSGEPLLCVVVKRQFKSEIPADLKHARTLGGCLYQATSGCRLHGVIQRNIQTSFLRARVGHVRWCPGLAPLNRSMFTTYRPVQLILRPWQVSRIRNLNGEVRVHELRTHNDRSECERDGGRHVDRLVKRRLSTGQVRLGWLCRNVDY